MNRRRALAITAAMLFALPVVAYPAFAQESEAPAAPPHKLPSVDDHLRVLAEKLDLTADQQEKAKPVIADMQAEIQKVYDDKSLTPEESMAKIHPIFMHADKQLREFLTDDQKAKLTELEQQMHPGQGKDNGSSPHD